MAKNGTKTWCREVCKVKIYLSGLTAFFQHFESSTQQTWWFKTQRFWLATQNLSLQYTEFAKIVISSYLEATSANPTSIWNSEERASWCILTIKPMRCTYFSNLFWNRTLHVLDRFSVHHQESSTVYTGTGICHTGYADCSLTSSQHNLRDVYLLLCIQY